MIYKFWNLLLFRILVNTLLESSLGSLRNTNPAFLKKNILLEIMIFFITWRRFQEYIARNDQHVETVWNYTLKKAPTRMLTFLITQYLKKSF